MGVSLRFLGSFGLEKSLEFARGSRATQHGIRHVNG